MCRRPQLGEGGGGKAHADKSGQGERGGGKEAYICGCPL